VLVVDDDSVMRKALGFQLKKLGHMVTGDATNGKEAVEAVLSERPSVVLMDVEMPFMDGLEATKAIQEQSPTPVVLLTAHSDPNFVRRASEAGAAAYLIKPSNPQEIERAILIAVARHADLMTLRKVNAELEQALHQVKTLSGLLPICAHCKKIRNDGGYWQAVESYLSAHTELQFTHGFCPDCLKTLYPDFVKARGGVEDV
jgi:DNA-binding NarL/FixJ family response regulator